MYSKHLLTSSLNENVLRKQQNSSDNHVASSGDYKRNLSNVAASTNQTFHHPLALSEPTTSLKDRNQSLSKKSSSDRTLRDVNTNPTSIFNIFGQLFSKYKSSSTSRLDQPSQHKTKKKPSHQSRIIDHNNPDSDENDEFAQNPYLDLGNIHKNPDNNFDTPMLSPYSNNGSDDYEEPIKEYSNRNNFSLKPPKECDFAKFASQKTTSNNTITTVALSRETRETNSEEFGVTVSKDLSSDDDHFNENDFIQQYPYGREDNNVGDDSDEDSDEEDDYFNDHIDEFQHIYSKENLLINWDNIQLYSAPTSTDSSISSSISVNESINSSDMLRSVQPLSPNSPRLKPVNTNKKISILGKGSFGFVVRGILKTSDGKLKDVAIKIATNASNFRQSQNELTKKQADKIFLKMKNRAIREAHMLKLVQSKVADKHVVSELYGIIDGVLPESFSKLLKKNTKEVAVGIVMEYEGGGSLEQLLSNKTTVIPLKEKFRLLVEIAKAIDALHAVGVIHADIKAANILLSSDKPCKVKLADFGMSRIYKLNDESSFRIIHPVKVTTPKGGNTTRVSPRRKMTRVDNSHSDRLSFQKMTKIAHGTRAFCAPEMLVNPYQPEILSMSDDKEAADKLSTIAQPSRRTDMYAFGLLAWQVLTQKRPFSDITSEAMLVSKVHKNHRPDLNKLPPETSKEVIDMIQSCWDGNREKRKTANECVIILEKAYKFLPFVNTSDQRSPTFIRNTSGKGQSKNSSSKDWKREINNTINNSTHWFNMDDSNNENKNNSNNNHSKKNNDDNNNDDKLQKFLSYIDSGDSSNSFSDSSRTSIGSSHTGPLTKSKYDKGLDMRNIYSGNNTYPDDISYNLEDYNNDTTERYAERSSNYSLNKKILSVQQMDRFRSLASSRNSLVSNVRGGHNHGHGHTGHAVNKNGAVNGRRNERISPGPSHLNNRYSDISVNHLNDFASKDYVGSYSNATSADNHRSLLLPDLRSSRRVSQTQLI